MRPDAIDCGDFVMGRTQMQNVKAVIEDIVGHGNDKCLLPGQLEANAAKVSTQHNGLLFTKAEIDVFSTFAKEAGIEFDAATLKTVEV
jgi:L-2-hydroxycarboxylate dehydrogenase (NAD+)